MGTAIRASKQPKVPCITSENAILYSQKVWGRSQLEMGLDCEFLGWTWISLGFRMIQPRDTTYRDHGSWWGPSPSPLGSAQRPAAVPPASRAHRCTTFGTAPRSTGTSQPRHNRRPQVGLLWRGPGAASVVNCVLTSMRFLHLLYINGILWYLWYIYINIHT